jgi:hypothetical protein
VSAGTITSDEDGSFTLTAHTSAGTLRIDSVIDLGCIITDRPSSGTAYIHNDGNGTVHITGISFVPPVRMVQGPGGDLAAGAVDSVTLEVTTNVTGDLLDSAEVVWNTSTDATPRHATVYLVGHVSNAAQLEVLHTAEIDFDTVDLGSSRGDSCIEVANYSCEALDSARILIEGSSSFTLVSSDTPGTLVDSAQWTYCFSFDPSRSGPDSAKVRFVTGTDTSGVIVLRGVGRGKDVPVTLALDTLYAVPGNVVPIHVRVVNDVTAAGITSVTFRVKYDLMQLDLRTPVAATPYLTAPTITDVAHSIDDHEITVTSQAPLTGSGIIAELPFEVLLPTASVADIAITSATFGTASASLATANPGEIRIVECDTNDRIVFVPKPIDVAQNMPNPARPRTSVVLHVQTPGYVTVRLENILGEEVGRPFSGLLEQGDRSIAIDASALSAGAYQYIVEWTDGTRVAEPIRKWMTVVR